MTRYDERFVESLRDEIEAQDEKLKKLEAENHWLKIRIKQLELEISELENPKYR